MPNFGITTSEKTQRELDELKRQWDEAEARSVSRSEVAEEALAIGVNVLLNFEAFQPAGGRFATQERRHLTLQALRTQHLEELEAEASEGDEPSDPA